MMKNKKTTGLFLVVLIAISFAFKQSPFFEIAKQIEIYNTLFKELNINYINEINPGDLTDKSIKNTLKNLDPYTNFFNEQDVEDAQIRREGEYGGIGISTFYDKNGITVSEVYEGFSGDKAGLKAGDIIFNVNNQNLEGLEREQLSSILKGIPGKKLALKVNRNGTTLDINLQLDKVVINPVPFSNMIDTETGYIVLTRFNAIASSEVKKAFISLKEKGMKKLVLDLRGNLGGSLRESINIVNFFVPKGSKVVETRGKTQANSSTYRGNKAPLDLEIPIVVLINGRSASASEIVSGALQDYDRAVILGERSFGKGLVQRYFPLSYGTQAKITISKYYTPSGRCIQELDYGNRDSKTGEVPKFSDGTVNKFTTTNGRPVYDGGGVTPDIKIEHTKKTAATENLIKSRAIFHFSTDYLAKNNAVSIENYTFSNTDFNQFKNYLLTQDTTFVTKQEKLFKEAYSSVEKNGFISSDYEKIQQKLKQEKVAEITKNEDVLSEVLQNEILEQKFYKKGMYEHHLKFDKTIKQAVDLLNNQSELNTILSK
ncbi:peptidase S41 [Tenacibaculum todarodis]|uniref:Peptidase S41 n=1 Tax=Tenacibaculum todarodis TaxID=1850252 RepID=A0A1L3JL80_9FLAO|nr:S41 family peptidase [Tenacibaculum todarodis]APG65862.1 peptidase S41 [Tenacibaculum todarodis]